MIGKRHNLILLAFIWWPLNGSVASADDLLRATGHFESTKTSQRQWMVVTNVFQGSEKTPAETHAIVYQNGVYYDFPADENQPWTIFDLPRDQVILLDIKHRQRTSLPSDDLIRLTARAQAEITAPDQRGRFGMDAEATQSNELQFAVTYADTQYQVTGVRPTDPDIAAQYGQFVDWVCRLNIARPRGVPPFARMKLNALMTSRNVMPQETSVILTRHLGENRTPATIRLRSTTMLEQKINDRLLGQIQDAQTMRVVFQVVPWSEFEH